MKVKPESGHRYGHLQKTVVNFIEGLDQHSSTVGFLYDSVYQMKTVLDIPTPNSTTLFGAN